MSLFNNSSPTLSTCIHIRLRGKLVNSRHLSSIVLQVSDTTLEYAL